MGGIGVWLVGARGNVATMAMVGARVIARGETGTSGMVTARKQLETLYDYAERHGPGEKESIRSD